MAGWSGFTDEDLRRMKVSSEKDERASRNIAQRQAQAQAAAKRQRQAQQRGAAAKRQSSRDHEPAPQIDPSMQLGSFVRKPKDDHCGLETTRKDGPMDQNGNTEGMSNGTSSGTEASKESNQNPEKEVKELDENEAMSVELENVQKFQQQQKVIEEANKQKRALLARAIEDRRKRAKAEADKLLRVQQELNHLDSLLTADVGIIRDKIEMASLEYMDAQKRYEKAEKEFIAAKMDLYHKGEAKESLTEHLYTIIHQNEVRKARKLVELMEKLAMEVSPEEMELTIPAIPQLSNFTAVATLHDPHSPHHPLNLAHQQHEQQQSITPSKPPMLQQLQQQQPLEQKETQEQTQQVTQQNQSQEQKAECTNVMPASGEKQQVDGAVLNANGPVTGCDTSPSESSAPPGEPASVFTESHPASTAGIAKPDPTNQTQPSVGDDPVSTVQSTSPGDNKETQSAPTNGEGTVQNGNVLSEQSVELDASTAPVKSPAKGWLNPFS
ncbi:hypothetical protein RRG08_042086 [Elysia crispata]|uniref:RAB6-interacting golgin n=1 Tax=Elysia crispata TaxID=231223 RepID=A0AAE1B248_9GAST|nr:hypothetical protein RRG08_042086 [Elysia crispata]